MLPGQMMNIPLTITSVMEFAARAHAKSEIVAVCDDNPLHRYTYADAFRRINQLAYALKDAGMVSGDRIATLAWNDHRHFELYYAVPCSGAICHTINPRLFPEQIEYIVNHAEDKILFVDPSFLPLIESLAGKLKTLERIVVLTGAEKLPPSDLENVFDYESFISGYSDDFRWPEIDENIASGLCYTSGTTGNPKGVLYSHRSTILHSYAAVMPDVMNISARDAILPIVPMFHVNAWSIPYAAPMAGAKLVFPGSKMADGKRLQSLIESEGVTMSAGVPTVWLALLNYLKESGKTVSSLERVVVGGAACPISIMKDFEENHGVDTQQAWGMTETSPLGVYNTLKPSMTSLPEGERDAIRIRQGRQVFGMEMRIINEAGNALPWDGKASGEVQVRGNWVCSGYFRNEKKALDDEGYFSTGDVANIDSDGFMRITDRTKDIIKSGGEWISSIDLENAAVDHPAIAEAAVIGVPHPKWTERPLLIVIKAIGAEITKDEILTHLGKRVAKWWIPDEVLFVEEIPHTATGKISKKDLRKMYVTS